MNVIENRIAEVTTRDTAFLESQTRDLRPFEQLISDADQDREMARVIALAQLLDPDAWASRETWRGVAEKARGRNTEHLEATYQRAANMAGLCVQPSIRKANSVLDLVRSWG